MPLSQTWPNVTSARYTVPLGGVEYRQIIGNIFAGVYDHQDVRKVLEDLDSHYNNALEKLPEEILKEYQHPQEVIDILRGNKSLLL